MGELASMIGGRWGLRVFSVLTALMLVVGGASPAQARRVALIIGNSTYTHANLLPNAGSDASLIAESARKVGFDVVLLNDLSRASFDQALRDFRRQADGAEVAMIYYAGHGMESAGKNWIIPVDAVLQDSLDLRYEAIELDGLLETVSGATLRLVLLDACRNNPFGKTWRSAVRTVPAGLAETELQGTGSLVMFAAAGGQVATDGLNGNSPFARAFARYLPEPGLSIHRLGPTVREEVIKDTGGSQSPWVRMTLDGKEFYLVPAAGTVIAGGGETSDRGTRDAYEWKIAMLKNTLAGYEDYLRGFPDGIFASDAKERLAQLQSAQQQTTKPVSLAVATPAPAPAPNRAQVMQPAPAPQPERPAAPALALPQAPAPTAPLATATVGTQDTALMNAAPRDAKALPAFPATPKFPASGYPNCREDFAAISDTVARVGKINDCLVSLSGYVSGVMNGFSASMIQYQQELNRLYKDEVAAKPYYTEQSQQRFYRDAMAEFERSNPDGANFADYRTAKQRYERDEAYLRQQYCIQSKMCVPTP